MADAELVPLAVQEGPGGFGDEVAETANGVLDDVGIGLNADVLEDLGEFEAEAVAFAVQTGEVIGRQPQYGVDYDLEEEEVLRMGLGVEFVEQQVEDVVALLQEVLVRVAEHKHCDLQQLLLGALGDDGVADLQYLANGGDAGSGVVLVVDVLVVVCELVLLVVLVLVFFLEGLVALAGGLRVFGGVVEEHADEQLCDVVGEGGDLLLEEVDQVFKVFDDGGVSF